MRRAALLGVAALAWFPVACADSGGAPGDESEGGGDASEGTTTSVAEPSTTAGDTTAGPLGPDDGAVTFYRDVLPIVSAHCIACHSDGNIAPFSLERYEDAWQWRNALVPSIETGMMPPWLPGDGCADYANEPVVTAESIDTLRAWAEEDGPRGDLADAPPPSGDLPGLPRVDLTLSVPEPYTPTDADDYRCFLLDWPEEQPMFVTGFRVAPTNLAIVHHVIAYRITPDRVADYEALDAADPASGYQCFGGPGGSVSDPGAGLWLGSWAPGGSGGAYPEGTGLPIEPGAKVVLQIHYNTAAAGEEPEPDQSAIELMLSPEVEREAFMMLWADPDWLGGQMPIPAGSPDTQHVFDFDPTTVMNFLTDVVPNDTPFLIHASSHHMHLLGRQGRHEIVRGGGDTECLLDIPAWDFAWQGAYRFAEPVRFMPGDQLRLACSWDNSAGTSEVNWGEGTSDEMCLGVFYVTPE